MPKNTPWSTELPLNGSKIQRTDRYNTKKAERLLRLFCLVYGQWRQKGFVIILSQGLNFDVLYGYPLPFRVAIGVRVPRRANGQKGTPLKGIGGDVAACLAKGQLLQFRAIGKRLRLHARDAVGQIHVGQLRAHIEAFLRDPCDAARNTDASEL